MPGEGNPDPSSKGGQAESALGWDAQGVGCHTQTPFLNPNPFHQWYGIKNISKVRVNGESCMALLDNGVQINTINLDFVESCSLEVGLFSDLVGRWTSCVGLGNALTQPVGYVIIWIQVDGVQGYNEDQIAMVILDLSNFATWVPHYSEDSHDKPCHKHVQGGDRHFGNALGKPPSGLSSCSLMGSSYNRG